MSFKCEPTSRSGLRDFAYQIREILGLQRTLYFPVIRFLEIIPELFSKFSFEIVEDDELAGNIYAETDVDNHIMYIKKSVYDNACKGMGRDRFIIAHEIGHYFLLCVLERKFARTSADIKKYEDPEWQANVFAGELLVPHHLVKKYKKATTISEKCGVSVQCAEVQLSYK